MFGSGRSEKALLVEEDEEEGEADEKCGDDAEETELEQTQTTQITVRTEFVQDLHRLRTAVGYRARKEEKGYEGREGDGGREDRR